MKKIPLTQAQHALVDDKDYEDLARFRWFANWDPGSQTYRAGRKIPHPTKPKKRTLEHMHRRILGLVCGDPRYVDHINHDGLDNRRRNLRVVTHRQNHENRRDQSRFGVGVDYRPSMCRSRPYRVRVWVDGKKQFVGFYTTAAEARKARKEFLDAHALT